MKFEAAAAVCCHSELFFAGKRESGFERGSKIKIRSDFMTQNLFTDLPTGFFNRK